jgi:hypothetical protein
MIEPGILWTCNGDAIVARKLYNDTEYRFTVDDLKETVANQWQGMFTPLKSSYMGRLGTTPNALQWYLTARPGSYAAMQVAFLNGQSTPTIEQGAVDFDQLGVSYRGYFDFGFALQDPRCIVKSKGQA